MSAPPPEAEVQPDGSYVLRNPDGSTLRYTQRGDGSWRKPERVRVRTKLRPSPVEQRRVPRAESMGGGGPSSFRRAPDEAAVVAAAAPVPQVYEELKDVLVALSTHEEREFLFKIEAEILAFIGGAGGERFVFPPMNGHFRRLLHITCRRFGLYSSSSAVTLWGLDKGIEITRSGIAASSQGGVPLPPVLRYADLIPQSVAPERGVYAFPSTPPAIRVTAAARKMPQPRGNIDARQRNTCSRAEGCEESGKKGRGFFRFGQQAAPARAENDSVPFRQVHSEYTRTSDTTAGSATMGTGQGDAVVAAVEDVAAVTGAEVARVERVSAIVAAANVALAAGEVPAMNTAHDNIVEEPLAAQSQVTREQEQRDQQGEEVRMPQAPQQYTRYSAESRQASHGTFQQQERRTHVSIERTAWTPATSAAVPVVDTGATATEVPPTAAAGGCTGCESETYSAPRGGRSRSAGTAVIEWPSAHHSSWRLRRPGSGSVLCKARTTHGLAIVFSREPIKGQYDPRTGRPSGQDQDTYEVCIGQREYTDAGDCAAAVPASYIARHTQCAGLEVLPPVAQPTQGGQSHV
eukprot:COSAG05_NODE_3196_length_2251_cov_5.082979_2_plen_575_part_01